MVCTLHILLVFFNDISESVVVLVMRGGKADNNPLVLLELPSNKIPPLRTIHFDSHVVLEAICVRIGFPTAYPIAIFNLKGTLIKTMYHSIGKALPCWKCFHVCTAVCEQKASACWDPWNFHPLRIHLFAYTLFKKIYHDRAY